LYIFDLKFKTTIGKAKFYPSPYISHVEFYNFDNSKRKNPLLVCSESRPKKRWVSNYIALYSIWCCSVVRGKWIWYFRAHRKLYSWRQPRIPPKWDFYFQRLSASGDILVRAPYTDFILLTNRSRYKDHVVLKLIINKHEWVVLRQTYETVANTILVIHGDVNRRHVFLSSFSIPPLLNNSDKKQTVVKPFRHIDVKKHASSLMTDSNGNLFGRRYTVKTIQLFKLVPHF
jgi:hypothetical protein